MASKEFSQEELKRQEIWAEVEAWKKKEYPLGLTWHIQLNNFHTYLPSLDERGDTTYSWWFLEYLDKKNSDTYSSEELQKMLEKTRRGEWGHSEIYLTQTFGEFLKNIRTAIEKNQTVTAEEIYSKKKLLAEASKNVSYLPGMSEAEVEAFEAAATLSHNILIQFYEYLLPLYVDLRVMGYSQYDLTA